MKIGISGSNGFIGKHLLYNLNLSKEYDILTCDRETLYNINSLNHFLDNCDVFVHLAGVNRETINSKYDNNIKIAENISSAINYKKGPLKVIFTSSTQEELNNFYGKSKRTAREIIYNSTLYSNNKLFIGLIIPNVFGPFCKPFYNSVFATFSHLLSEGKELEIIKDNPIRFIYINNLIRNIIKEFKNEESLESRIVPEDFVLSTSELAKKLSYFNSLIRKTIELPNLNDINEKNLFLSFYCYQNIEDSINNRYLKHEDARGAFFELVKSKSEGQFSFSLSKPGVVRGNHYHTRKFERFMVIRGLALIKIRRIDSSKTYSFIVNGNEPVYIDIPIWHTHSIENIGENDLITNFWINEFYDLNDPDTYLLDV